MGRSRPAVLRMVRARASVSLPPALALQDMDDLDHLLVRHAYAAGDIHVLANSGNIDTTRPLPYPDRAPGKSGRWDLQPVFHRRINAPPQRFFS
jgi:hypothetical protein